jgi:hypothetical protein
MEFPTSGTALIKGVWSGGVDMPKQLPVTKLVCLHCNAHAKTYCVPSILEVLKRVLVKTTVTEPTIIQHNSPM